MSAKEMFNALGYYEKDFGRTNILCYEKDISIPDVPHYIGFQFVLTHERISIYSHVGGKYEYGKDRNYSYGAFNGFDVELLRAIEQQMKELGWLDEEETCQNLSEYNLVDGFECSNCGIIIENYNEIEIDEDYPEDRCMKEYAPKYCPNCGRKIVD